MEGNLLHQFETIMSFFTRNLKTVQVKKEFNSMGELEIPYTCLVELVVMVKLLYPDNKYTNEEALEIIEFAAECRKRVKDQLYIIDETFKAKPAMFEYLILKTGETKQIETLKRIENPTITEEILAEESKEIASDPSAITPRANARPRIVVQLASKQVDIRLNQRGVSCKSLFGDYIRTAKKITIVAPFIRVGHQIDNLIEFIQMAREVCLTPEELEIEMHTQNEEDKIPEAIDIFNELQEELSSYGVTFNFMFDAEHDRKIDLDNGWTINIGRGLDIFEKFPRLSLSNSRQENRRCKEFSMTYMYN